MKVWMITGAGRGSGRAFVQEAVNKGEPFMEDGIPHVKMEMRI